MPVNGGNSWTLVLRAEIRASASNKPWQEAPPWLWFRPMMYAFNTKLQFDLPSLSFLFGDDTEVVRLLMVAELRYTDFANLVDRFNDASSDLQRKLSGIGVTDGTMINLAEIESKTSAEMIAKNNSLASALRPRFEKDEFGYRAAAEALRAALVRRFSDKKVIPAKPLTAEQSQQPTQ